jgi:isoleucyl-tRNA synthetase
MPSYDPALRLDDAARKRWEILVNTRVDVNKALEDARGRKLIGKSLEAQVDLSADGEVLEALRGFDLPKLLIVSKVTLAQGASDAAVRRAPGGKCVRCWGYFEDLGTHPEHPELCPRCTQAVLP